MKTTIKTLFILLLAGCRHDDSTVMDFTKPQVTSQKINGRDTVLTLKYYYPSGKVKCISEVTTYGKKHGFETFFFENGIQKYEYYFIGKSVWGVGKGHTITGDSLYLGDLAFGIGEFRQYSDSGNLQVQGFYKDSHQDSIWTFYYPSGKLERKVGWKNGLQHGIFERYFESGKIDQNILWEHGYMIHSKDYFESGRPFREIHYKNGAEDGQAIEYYDADDKIRQIRNYKDGKENGYVYQYNPDGTLQQKAKLLNGQFIDTLFIYNSNGEVIQTKIVKQQRSTTTTI